jgi:predicted DNA binding CopG/RHH family protein
MKVNAMNKKTVEMPKFKSESEEADWWASRAGRQYVKQKSAEAESKGIKASGSIPVAKLNQKSSIQIAIRLPEADIVQARKLAERKGLGYQTLLKMLVHEGLAREARRG